MDLEGEGGSIAHYSGPIGAIVLSTTREVAIFNEDALTLTAFR